MLNWIQNLLARKRSDKEPNAEHVVALERENQSLRMELQEQRRNVAALTDQLDRQLRSETDRLARSAREHIELLVTAVAAPVARLLTQAHLLEVQGKPVQAKEVLAVARRLVRALEDVGLQIEGQVGEKVTFDPSWHELLSTEDALAPGQPAVIRFVGVAFHGQRLLKAGVEAAK